MTRVESTSVCLWRSPRRAARRWGAADGEGRANRLAGGQPRCGRHLREAFRQGLRDLGYVEGRNVVIEYRVAEGKLERYPALAAELVALKVDVIVAGTTPAALAAKQATRALPIVFPAASDPVTAGSSPAMRGQAAMSRGCLSSPRISRQISGSAQAGRSGDQSGGCPVAAGERPKRTCEGRRSGGTGAGGAASIR